MRTCVTLNLTAREPFRLYDAFLFVGKPDLKPYGIKRDAIYYESDLFAPSGQDPHEGTVRAAARQLIASGYPFNEPVELDVERWEWYTRFATEAEATLAMDKMTQIIRWFRDEAPQYTKVGYYSAGPNREYWPAQQPESPAYAKWQASNDFLAPLIWEMDALYPSLYTFYDDRPGWVTYANANISEARRIAGGRPIYPFIWPRYHEGGDMNQVYIDYEFWKLQLETLKASGVPGAVLWGGYRETWPGDPAWWQATQDFLRSNQCTSF